MKLYKLSQGSTFENLKHFIYITNEYGVPSAEFIDAFIEQFGKVILNGNFTLNQIEIKQLDNLWLDIVKDCEYNNVEYKENYSNLFYISLCQKAVLKIKEGYEQSDWNKLGETKKLELLKQFILNFEQYKDEFIETDNIEEEDMAYSVLKFELTPGLIKEDVSGEYIEVTHARSKIKATGRLYKDNHIVLNAGSVLEYNRNIEDRILKDREKIEHMLDGSTLKADIYCRTPSNASGIIRGSRANGWTDWVNNYGLEIDIYREDGEFYSIIEKRGAKFVFLGDDERLGVPLQSNLELNNIDYSWVNSKSKKLNKLSKRRDKVQAAYRVNNNIIEQLEIDTCTETVTVIKSSIDTLINQTFGSIEEYLFNYYVKKLDNYDYIPLCKEVIETLESIRQGELWEVQMGSMFKPLCILYDWEDK